LRIVAASLAHNFQSGVGDNVGTLGCWKDQLRLPIVEHSSDEPQIAELARSFAYYSCFALDSWSAILHGSTHLTRQSWLEPAAGELPCHDMSYFLIDRILQYGLSEISKVPDSQVLPDDRDVPLKRGDLLHKCVIVLIWKWTKLQSLGEDRSWDNRRSLLRSPPDLEYLGCDMKGLLICVPWSAQIIVGPIRGVLGPVPIHRRVGLVPTLVDRPPMLRILQRVTLRRYRATLSASQAMQPYMVFDRNAKRKQKDRAALKESGNCSRLVDYVRDEVADRMMERLLVCICLD